MSIEGRSTMARIVFGCEEQEVIFVNESRGEIEVYHRGDKTNK
jgi:hypothetical protein